MINSKTTIVDMTIPPQNKWYAKRWVKHLCSINGGMPIEAQNAFPLTVNKETSFRFWNEEYKPTIKQRLKLLFK